jgi:hypothetical protein
VVRTQSNERKRMVYRRTWKSDSSRWVITFVPEGETVMVPDKDVPYVPFDKGVDVVQIHTLTQNGVFGHSIIGQEPVSTFLKRTEGLDKPSQVKRAFNSPNDGISVETLRQIRTWLKSDKGHMVVAADYP